MESLFIKLINLSIYASILVAVVLLLRLVSRRSPKWVICLIWALVGIRLVVPFSIQSSFSLLPQSEPVSSTALFKTVSLSQAQEGIVSSGAASVTEASRSGISSVFHILSYIWLFGVILMLLYGVISYIVLRKTLRTATLYDDGIRQSEKVDSPFVLGFLRPTIYIPYTLFGKDLEYVLSHEKTHIRRKDHLWKPAGFLLLSVYWFNPAIWLAYAALSKDIELACDESVIRSLDKDERKNYSRALLNLSIRQKLITACPVAFGKTAVRNRVDHVMNYKKPALWSVVIMIACCVAVGICFMTEPKKQNAAANEIDETQDVDDSEEGYIIYDAEKGLLITNLSSDPEDGNGTRYIYAGKQGSGKAVIDVWGPNREYTVTMADSDVIDSDLDMSSVESCSEP